MNMKKSDKVTFWTVKYAVWGAERPSVAWFKSYENAKTFSRADYRDNPVKRTFTAENARKIAREIDFED